MPVKVCMKQSATETYLTLERKMHLSMLYSVHDSLCILTLCQRIRDFIFIVLIIYAIQLPHFSSRPQEELKSKVLRH